tara:strand:+ start:869 stop:1090 length:222 start_codon:yes stop_codon:yes gene_type:complete
MAITPESPGSVTAPNTLTSEGTGAVAVPNTLPSEAAGTIAPPNELVPTGYSLFRTSAGEDFRTSNNFNFYVGQ